VLAMKSHLNARRLSSYSMARSLLIGNVHCLRIFTKTCNENDAGIAACTGTSVHLLPVEIDFYRDLHRIFQVGIKSFVFSHDKLMLIVQSKSRR
jgi:hypothetical protein